MADLFIHVQRTADRLMQGLEDALRPTGITPVQYLVLRSLRQAGAAGMPSNQIVRDMTTHDPDMTRLLDKLEER
ncbi:MAG: MarR family transcriptional regulator, partial [Burkholderiales bacterium]|nr:MarR family transcriptional regulator [Phycisphaerae bacterium]